MAMKPDAGFDLVYAIVRLNDFFVRLDKESVMRAALARARDWVAVRKIVRNPGAAEAEVEHLNRRHRDEGCL
jgi:hypothetical protein